MSKDETKKLSKLLSYILRHNPAHLGIALDENGWTNVNVLLQQLNQSGPTITFDLLKHVVDTNEKRRFSFNDDLTMIRASQGHSIEIELNYTPQIPPRLLFHGTAEKNLAEIHITGLLKMSRHHVHLSADEETARKVGQRHGKPIVLSIASLQMHEKGYVFYVSDNGVWLTEHVPAGFIISPHFR